VILLCNYGYPVMVRRMEPTGIRTLRRLVGLKCQPPLSNGGLAELAQQIDSTRRMSFKAALGRSCGVLNRQDS
jgi:hypothetical protein